MKHNRIPLTLVALALLLAACGGDDDSSTNSTASEASPSTVDTTEADNIDAPSDSTAAPEAALDLDTTGDGKVVFGVATPGPRNDGGYYQALVDGVTKFSEDNGYEPPIVVDKILPEEAAQQLDSLARQGVDVITVGASEIADTLPDLTEQYSDVIWYCNCGSAYEELPNLIQSRDFGEEINYSAGVATGLLMQAAGQTKAAMIGNNNFNFEKLSFATFRTGLDAVDPAYEWTYVATGSFNDVAAATEAFNNLVDQGVGAVYPYLGGAHEAIVKLANEQGIITMSAGAANACERTDLTYDIAVKFDAGEYLGTILEEIKAGELQRGQVREFHVGRDPEVGAVICSPTAEQTAAMDEAYARLASGELDAPFAEARAEAFGS
jgi:basic membrane protein A